MSINTEQINCQSVNTKSIVSNNKEIINNGNINVETLTVKNIDNSGGVIQSKTINNSNNITTNSITSETITTNTITYSSSIQQDDLTEHNIIVHDGYVQYHLYVGAYKYYRVLSHVVIDETDKKGLFWTEPISLGTATVNNNIHINEIRLIHNNKTYLFYPYSYRGEGFKYEGSGHIIYSNYKQLENNWIGAFYSHSSYTDTWQTTTNKPAVNEQPVITLIGCKFYLKEIKDGKDIGV